MPKSKSKRKKTGGFIARQRDAKIVRTGKAADKDTYVRAWRRLDEERKKMLRTAGLMELRMTFVDDEELQSAFFRAQYALRRLAEGAEHFTQDDWKTVASSLMLGAKVFRHFKEAGYALDDGILKELRHPPGSSPAPGASSTKGAGRKSRRRTSRSSTKPSTSRRRF